MKKIVALCLAFFTIQAVAGDEFTQETNYIHQLCIPALIRIEAESNPEIIKLDLNKEQLGALIETAYIDLLPEYQEASQKLGAEIKQKILQCIQDLDSQDKLAFILCNLYEIKSGAQLMYVFEKCGELTEIEDYEYLARYLDKCHEAEEIKTEIQNNQ